MNETTNERTNIRTERRELYTPWHKCQGYNKPAHELMVLITFMTSEGSGEPAHSGSLARAFAICTHKVWK